MPFIENIELGNHHYYGICKDTFEYRGNKILEDSHVFLLNNNDIPMEDKIKIKCWQFWIVGFLSGQNCIIRDENLVTIYK
jgi:hypothetical protein